MEKVIEWIHYFIIVIRARIMRWRAKARGCMYKKNWNAPSRLHKSRCRRNATNAIFGTFHACLPVHLNEISNLMHFDSDRSPRSGEATTDVALLCSPVVAVIFVFRMWPMRVGIASSMNSCCTHFQSGCWLGSFRPIIVCAKQTNVTSTSKGKGKTVHFFYAN